jgi:hypothetical protein
MASIIDDQKVIRAIKGIYVINYSLVEGVLWFFFAVPSRTSELIS